MLCKFLLLIFNFILLWSENISCVISIPLHWSKFVLWPSIWSILEDVLLLGAVFYKSLLGLTGLLLFRSSITLLSFSLVVPSLEHSCSINSGGWEIQDQDVRKIGFIPRFSSFDWEVALTLLCAHRTRVHGERSFLFPTRAPLPLWGPTLMNSFDPTYLLKAPFLNTLTVRVRTSTWISREHNLLPLVHDTPPGFLKLQASQRVLSDHSTCFRALPLFTQYTVHASSIERITLNYNWTHGLLLAQ